MPPRSEQTRLPPPANSVGGSRRRLAKPARPAKRAEPAEPAESPSPPQPKIGWRELLQSMFDGASALKFQSDTEDNNDKLKEFGRFLRDDKVIEKEDRRLFARRAIDSLCRNIQDPSDKGLSTLLEDASRFKQQTAEASDALLDGIYQAYKSLAAPDAPGSSASRVFFDDRLQSLQKDLVKAVSKAEINKAEADKKAAREVNQANPRKANPRKGKGRA